jgi:hypothetical protein
LFFHSLNIFQRVNFDEVKFIFLLWWILLSVLYLRKICLNHIHKDFYTIFFPEVVESRFYIYIYDWFWVTLSMVWCMDQGFLFVCIWIPNRFSSPLKKTCLYSIKLLLQLCWQPIKHICVNLFLDFLFSSFHKGFILSQIFYHCSFTIRLEIWKYKSSNLVLCKIVLALLVPLHFYIFWNHFVTVYKKWDFNWNFIDCADEFGDEWHLNSVLQIPEHSISLFS